MSKLPTGPLGVEPFTMKTVWETTVWGRASSGTCPADSFLPDGSFKKEVGELDVTQQAWLEWGSRKPVYLQTAISNS